MMKYMFVLTEINLSLIFYILNGVAAISTAMYFFRSKESLLQTMLVLEFLTLAWYQFGWAIYIAYLGHPIGTNFLLGYAGYIINLPFVIANLAFIFYLTWRK